MESLPPVARRFLRYVRIDTQSDPHSDAVPSTERQKDLGRLLVDELRHIGLDDAEMDGNGYVYATVPSNLPPAEAKATPVVALLAHMDTSADAPGAGVTPVVHPAYDGGPLSLPGDPSIRLDPAVQPALLDHVGEDLITSDGTTLLGSDDKAGVAVLMQLAEDLLARPDVPRPTLRLCFTIDEEIGRGVDHLDLAVLGADVAYTLDGSGVDTLYAETFNAAEAVLTIRGVMVHPGYAYGVMVNAVRILGAFLAMLPADEAPETTRGRAGYLHPHTVEAGDASQARVQLILRDFDADGLARRKRLVAEMVDTLRAQHPGATFELVVRDQYKNMRSYIEATDPRVLSFAEAAAAELGIDLKRELVRGGTDGARLSERGLPTPNVFNGGYDYHSRFEWNTVQNLERSLAYTLQLVSYWARHGAA